MNKLQIYQLNEHEIDIIKKSEDDIKNHYEKKKLINLLLSEIDDEIESISSIAKSSLKFIDSINYYLNINRDISFNIIFPPEINIYSINKILENHYTQITYEQRSTLKLIKSTIIFLNDKSEKIKKDFTKIVEEVFDYYPMMLQVEEQLIMQEDGQLI